MSETTTQEPQPETKQQLVSTYAYGVELKAPAKLPEHVVELFFFQHAPALIEGTMSPGKGRYSGEGRMWHAQKLVFLLCRRTIDMHEWTEDQLRLFCDYQWSTVAGPAAGGKTTTAAVFAMLFWLCNPLDSAVIVTSTTVQGLRKRIWGEIMRLWRTLSWLSDTANLIESKCCLQAQKGDDTHGIFGIAVAGGQTEKALGRIIGFHPKRLLVVVDEMTDTPEAIVEACVNLSKTEGEFRFIGIGNPKSKLDPHGKMSEPKAGWDSVNVDSEFWETKDGACLHLDGFKSPNLKAGKNKYPYLIKQKDIDKDISKYGENSPKVWRFDRGFWAPDDLEQKVFTESMFTRSHCKGQATWFTGYRMVAGLDPAHGGDKCMLRFARYGMGNEGKIIIEFTEAVTIKLDASIQDEPLNYQIARQAREACKQRGVEPENFGIDTTGLGSGAADILQREWSMRIQRISFNDRPTERVVSDTNPNKCSQEYYNFVTELWFAVRRFLESDQLRGLTEDDIFQFASRPYSMKGTLYQVLPKPELKALIGCSPDLADSDSIVCEVIRRHGVNPSTSDSPTFAASAIEAEKISKKFDFDSHPDSYGATAEIGGYSDNLY